MMGGGDDTHPLTISEPGGALLPAYGSLHTDMSLMKSGLFGIIGMHNVNYWINEYKN